LLLLALALAGCGGGAEVPVGIPVDDEGKALPTLQGVVVDEAIRPLAGAFVRLLGSDLNATTDAEGHYELRRPTLVAEQVLVTASLAGYRTQAQQTQVSGYTSHTLDFILQLDPPPVARVEVLQATSTVTCYATTPLPPPADAMECELGGNKAAWAWNVLPDRAWSGTIVEVHWDATSAFADNAHGWIQGPEFEGHPGPVLVEATGASPLRFELTQEQARAVPRNSAIQIALQPVATSGAVGLAVNQVYETYASMFYVDPAPPGYQLA
jgi:hypothetical protein